MVACGHTHARLARFPNPDRDRNCDWHAWAQEGKLAILATSLPATAAVEEAMAAETEDGLTVLLE